MSKLTADFDAATSRELADQLTKVAGQPIDAAALAADLESCARRYLFARYCEGRRGRGAESRNLLRDALRQAKKLGETLEELKAAEHRDITFVIGDAYYNLPETDAEITAEIAERWNNQEPNEFGEKDPVIAYDVAADDILGLSAMLKTFDRRMGAAFDHVNEETGQRRRPPERCLPMLVSDLASVYECHTGLAPTTIYNNKTNKRGSPFVDLVERVFAKLEPDKKRFALADTVKNALKDWKRTRSEGDPLPLT